MSLFKKINEDLIVAMKAREADKLSTLRMVVSALKYKAIDDGELSDSDVVAVLRLEAKKRKEAVEAFTKGDRKELAEKEMQELKLIDSYLPSQLSIDQVSDKVDAILSDSDVSDFGQAMRLVMSDLKGEADGKMVSESVQKWMSKNDNN